MFRRLQAIAALVVCLSSSCGCSHAEPPKEGAPAKSAPPVEDGVMPPPPAPQAVNDEAHAAPATSKSPFCQPPRAALAANVEACAACEKAECDVPVLPGCTKYAEGSADRRQCENVLTCIRSTNCINLGNVDCYCGVTDIVACKESAANAKGACKDVITAAFPRGLDGASIVNRIGDVSIPGGAALALGQCDNSRCGDQNGNRCVPFCK
jgi:hypothetical protein